MLEQTAKEPTSNFWKTIEYSPLQMVYPPLDDEAFVAKKIVTTRPYNYVKHQTGKQSFERKLTSRFEETFYEGGFYAKKSNACCCKNQFISKIPFQSMVESYKNVSLMIENSKRDFVFHSLALNAPISI